MTTLNNLTGMAQISFIDHLLTTYLTFLYFFHHHLQFLSKMQLQSTQQPAAFNRGRGRPPTITNTKVPPVLRSPGMVFSKSNMSGGSVLVPTNYQVSGNQVYQVTNLCASKRNGQTERTRPPQMTKELRLQPQRISMRVCLLLCRIIQTLIMMFCRPDGVPVEVRVGSARDSPLEFRWTDERWLCVLGGWRTGVRGTTWQPWPYEFCPQYTLRL